VDQGKLTSDLAAALIAAGLPDPEVEIRTCETIERHPATGKVLRFVPLAG